MENDKLIILGTKPPPLGGVTVHILRLTEMLERNNISFKFFDLRPKKKLKLNIWRYLKNFLSIFICEKKENIHYQLNNWMEAAFLSILCRMFNKKLVYTVHSFTLNIKSVGFFKKIAIHISKKNVDLFIAPSETIKQLLIENAFSKEKITVLDTFLPPSEKELNQTVPSEVLRFVSTGDKIILANASTLYLNKNGIDVYGLDMCIQACSKIQDVKFLYCIPMIGDQKYYQKCLAEIKRLGIKNRFKIYNNEVSLVSVFPYCDLFVRPTVSDSFGISVAEALLSNVPAIASDVCERAEGTVLFESRNVDDFILKIEECLETKKRYEYIRQDFLIKYLKVYKNLNTIDKT